MGDTSIPVLPVTANGYHGDWHGRHDGFEPSDAALVQANHLSINGLQIKDAQVESLRTSKDVLVNRFELERAIKENSVQAERLERENQNVMRSEFAALKLSMAEAESRRLQAEATDRRFGAIESVLKDIVSKLPTP